MKFYSWLIYPFIILTYWAFFVIAKHFISPDGPASWLSILVASFAVLGPLSNWLIRSVKRDMLILRALYLISSTWLGIMLNLGLAAAVVSLIDLSIPLSQSVQLAAWIIIGLGLGIIGHALAAWPRVREEEAYIDDLPEGWEGKKVVQISDLHLGPIYRHRFFGRILRKIKALSPEALFITGDMFDDIDLEFDWVDKLMTGFSAPRGVYYSFGNHDLMLGFERVKAALSGDNVRILDNEKIESAGLQIIGIDFSFDRQASLGAALEKAGHDSKRPSILLFHEPKGLDEAKARNVSLMLSGHTHYGQFFPLNFLTTAYYHGHDKGIYHEGSFSLSVCVGTGTWGPPMRTNSRSEIVAITLRKKR